MNVYQQKLYTNLMSLVQTNEAFYFQDFQLDGKTYRIFNYRLASYTNFLAPSAIECRGIMFEVDSASQALRLASLPMEKFWNLNENPMTMDLDLSKVESIEEKADGSLMSTYLHEGELRLKSKGSLFSDQAIAAMKWLDRPSNYNFKNVLTVLADLDDTVNLEWCSPEHRIVLGYMEPTLKVLNVRRNETGEYVDVRDMFEENYMVSLVDIDGTYITPEEFVESIPAMTDVEGFVLVMENGQRVKVKCDWYLSLHHNKDSVSNPRRLFECILDGGIDDIRAMFHDDLLSIKLIDEMQQKVDHLYNHMVSVVEEFHTQNKHLDRRTYAIKGQQDPSLKQGNLSYFSLVMNKYLDKTFDYKTFLMSKWKELGLRDAIKVCDSE
jgi:T4 RnlA family RNA ligase